MKRVYNFSAGPSMLPLEVLKRVQEQLLDYEGSGMSVMEMSHRSKYYDKINNDAEALLRELMNIPENYDIIFIQGGASTQFEAIPLNINVNGKADYILSGNFSTKSYKEAKKFTDAVAAASSEDKNFTYIPHTTRESFRPDADYVHMCYNNTIYGTRFTKDTLPDTGDIPLVGDVSSNILSEEIDVSKFGVLYGGAQKNIAPAGVTVVIVRKDLQEKFSANCPTMLKWSTQIKNKSLYNTPPCWSTYVAVEVFKYLKEIGGVKAMQKINEEKAKILYDYLDNSKFFTNKNNPADRSLMNVPFFSPSAELDAKFIAEAKEEGLETLKGHKLVGGMRASIYNAMPTEGVKKLVAFMEKFEKANG